MSGASCSRFMIWVTRARLTLPSRASQVGLIVDLAIFVHARLALPMGDRGCFSLFGRAAGAHRLLAEQLTAEYRVRTEGRGRVVDEWRMRPEAQDNHWLDGLVGCAVAASIQGAVLPGTDAKAAPARAPMKLSELRRSKR